MLTPYQYASNRPIDGIDLDGLEFLEAFEVFLDLMDGSYEGKLFWTTGKDAAWYKNWLGSGNVTLKIKTDKSFIFENGTDAGRLFYYVSPERLEQLNKAIKSATIK